MRAVHVTVIGEKEDMRVGEQAGLLQRLDDAAVVPVEIFDHGVVAGEIAPHLSLDGGNTRDIRPESDALRIVIGHELRGRYAGIVRRLNAEDGEEGLGGAAVLRSSARSLT